MTWDPKTTDKNIASLHPAIRQDVEDAINELEYSGVKVRVTFGYRSNTEQDKLYAQGRTTPGPKVTNARGSESIHNYALAVDVVEIQPMYGYSPDGYPSERWNTIAKVFKSRGFAWGNDWTGFKDKPHFEKTFGMTIPQLQKSEKIEGYVKLP